ncbi:hypothetical protein GCM10011611_39110 [Aliidongia dinghuensis]|uniref:Uncharacterized protein n=1 Tax=Aliidongia dinghuensis TaxID=1867774 RepID=A0A8J3E4Q8_9PROT|nr:hypothetical protein GCM10011611_39110 [Aliidongia dinghuensis]
MACTVPREVEPSRMVEADEGDDGDQSHEARQHDCVRLGDDGSQFVSLSTDGLSTDRPQIEGGGPAVSGRA